MTHPLSALDRRVDRLTRAGTLALALSGVLVVGGIDYLTGYEVSMSLFYLGPVALAAWYGGRWPGLAVAIASCVSWYIAELAAGGQYSHPAIPVWNALVRFGFFLVTSSLVAALRENLRVQQALARTDSLTGLYGRRAFEERLGHDLSLAQRRKSALTLAYVDLDDFKVVNDTLGHAEGDRVLRVIGQVLKRSVREVDTAARLGGDEFALVLPDTDGPGAQRVIAKLTRELHEALETDTRRTTFSIGVVTVPDAATSPEHAVAAADELMYRVKRKGKGAVEFSVLGESVEPRASADAVRSPPAG